jgi:hypothetical protein
VLAYEQTYLALRCLRSLELVQFLGAISNSRVGAVANLGIQVLAERAAKPASNLS